MLSKKGKKPVILVVLDGFGYSAETVNNAVYTASTPYLDQWMRKCPNTLLSASGVSVGLPDGYIGNSEVGHTTIGCGRVIEQSAYFIDKAIGDGSFFKNKVLLHCLEKVKKSTGRLHLIGLLSDAGVHSHIEHLYAFLKAAKKQGIKEVFLHLFLDGRDVGPKTAEKYLKNLDAFMKKNKIGEIASLHGRFYAMDRDENWDRIKKSYDVLIGNVKGYGDFSKEYKDYNTIIANNYKAGITDEFISPVSILPEGIIKKGDGILFFNFRPDRARELTESFVKKFDTCCFVTPVAYDDSLCTDTMFKVKKNNNCLKEILSNNGKTIFSIAETEKYAHVTYFFSGGQEQAFEGEQQVLIPSIKAKDYVSHPCMSAKEITNAVLYSLEHDPKDFYVINYANADMVGHSGNFEATVKAVECLDVELKKLYDTVIEKMDGTMYITADHGNAEKMFDDQLGQVHTAHTTNKVPFIYIKKGLENSNIILKLEQLADIAPFILQNMAIQVPKEMQ